MTRNGHRLASQGPNARQGIRVERPNEGGGMEKRARGEIRVHERVRDGNLTYSIRFRVNGKRHSMTLGTDAEGWTDRKAERKLEDVLAQVRAGVWEPESVRATVRFA